MEVHHHPDVEKKGFKEYLLEGLMIFLAVMMGFFAETIRENISENKIAREYAELMTEDLKKDTVELNNRINELKFVSAKLDTFVTFVHTKKLSDLPGGTWYYYGRFGTRINLFQSVNATLDQLKSSGSLRLFRNTALVNAIAQFDAASQYVLQLADGQQRSDQANVLQLRNRLFDAYNFIRIMDLKTPQPVIDSFKRQNILLLNDDHSLMVEYANYCQGKSFNNKLLIDVEASLLKKATELLTVLNKQYDFK